MILSLDEFLFTILTPFWTFTNCIQEDIHIYPRGKPRFGELLKEKTLEKRNIHSFFEKDPKQN